MRHHEPLGKLFQRLIAEELGRAVAAAGDPALSLEERVHELRSRLKKARAVVRLLRTHEGRPARRARREDHWMRDVARTLAAGREALVMPLTLQRVRAVSRKSKHHSDLNRLLGSAEAAARRELSGAAQTGIERALRKAAAAIRGHRSRLADASLSHPRRVLRNGLLASYRDARRALAKLPPAPSPEPLHRWRTQVKRLGYQVRLLRRIAPAIWRALGAPLERLGDELGEVHDLVVLESWIAAQAPISGPAARARLTAAITEVRHQRERQARVVGKRLLKERPRALEEKLKKAWRAWR
ncbi:MAG TPA: CHAD domain-containing protein [Polyangia bacterium]|nr:CHAD domain-containing protein [Polyangia bacterium]